MNNAGELRNGISCPTETTRTTGASGPGEMIAGHTGSSGRRVAHLRGQCAFAGQDTPCLPARPFWQRISSTENCSSSITRDDGSSGGGGRPGDRLDLDGDSARSARRAADLRGAASRSLPGHSSGRTDDSARPRRAAEPPAVRHHPGAGRHAVEYDGRLRSTAVIEGGHTRNGPRVPGSRRRSGQPAGDGRQQCLAACAHHRSSP